LIDVDVCVHQSRQQRVVAAVPNDRIGRNFRGSTDGANRAVLNEQSARLCALWRDDTFRDEGMCHNLIIA
jgi:hypothetical protein